VNNLKFIHITFQFINKSYRPCFSEKVGTIFYIEEDPDFQGSDQDPFLQGVYILLKETVFWLLVLLNDVSYHFVKS
jgi:hypothetical protein